MTAPIRDAALSRLIERQMRNWELARAQRTVDDRSAAREVAEFVTISRSYGSGGGHVGRTLGERLGWPVFDREILQSMAENDNIRAKLYETMDERDLSWFEEQIQALTHGHYMPGDYFHKLSETVLSLARQGPAVFIGRAADLILPQDAGLRVRVVAPLEVRQGNLARSHNLQPGSARAELERVDAQRTEFLRDHFHVRWEDQTRHDVIINLQRLSALQAVELITTAMQLRGLHVRDRSHQEGCQC